MNFIFHLLFKVLKKRKNKYMPFFLTRVLSVTEIIEEVHRCRKFGDSALDDKWLYGVHYLLTILFDIKGMIKMRYLGLPNCGSITKFTNLYKIERKILILKVLYPTKLILKWRLFRFHQKMSATTMERCYNCLVISKF